MTDKLIRCSIRLPIICSAHNSFAIKSDASDELLVAFQYPQTRTEIYVPQSYCVITTATHYEVAMVLETSNSSSVAIQGSYKLAARCVPHLDNKT